MTQACGHPLAARQIVFDAELVRLRTVCWACRVEASITRRKHDGK